MPRFPVEKWNDVVTKGKEYSSTVQNLSTWMEVFEKETLPKIKDRSQMCFIGHSIGPVFILHILEKYQLQLDSAIFVSPFLTTLDRWEFNAVNETFYKQDFDFEKLKKLISVSYALYGDNDPYVPIQQPIAFAEKMNSSKVIIKGGHHLNEDINLTNFPLVLDLCKTRLG